jgi:hypothetical protein
MQKNMRTWELYVYNMSYTIEARYVIYYCQLHFSSTTRLL